MGLRSRLQADTLQGERDGPPPLRRWVFHTCGLHLTPRTRARLLAHLAPMSPLAPLAHTWLQWLTWLHWLTWQDGIDMPYENVLDYESFAVRLREQDLPSLIPILKVSRTRTPPSTADTTQYCGQHPVLRPLLWGPHPGLGDALGPLRHRVPVPERHRGTLHRRGTGGPCT